MSERSVSAVILGLVFVTAPVTFGMLPIDITFPMMDQLITVLYGVLMISAGLFVGGAKRYKSLLDLYGVVGVALVVAGPLTSYPLGEEFWTTITFVTAIFLGLPTALLLRLSKKQA
ncbi:hypothetical protein ACK3SF_03530 [Candidatus Nanosalina sp. VS9-1]|uniref:hypothetical protein n=1 Tax=Candidatus Nanosalina sp. VS9-1 TaxID=3388566 RepID=UPI0039E0422C